MSNVEDFNGITRLPADPDRLLEKAKGSLEVVVIIGYDKEGDYYFKSSTPDGAEAVWLLELTKKYLLETIE